MDDLLTPHYFGGGLVHYKLYLIELGPREQPYQQLVFYLGREKKDRSFTLFLTSSLMTPALMENLLKSSKNEWEKIGAELHQMTLWGFPKVLKQYQKLPDILLPYLRKYLTSSDTKLRENVKNILWCYDHYSNKEE